MSMSMSMSDRDRMSDRMSVSSRSSSPGSERGGVNNTAAHHGLHFPARCIAAQTAGPEQKGTRFFVGTLALHDEENEIQLIEAAAEAVAGQSVQVVSRWPHTGEIWALAPSPTDSSLLATAYNTGLLLLFRSI